MEVIMNVLYNVFFYFFNLFDFMLWFLFFLFRNYLRKLFFLFFLFQLSQYGYKEGYALIWRLWLLDSCLFAKRLPGLGFLILQTDFRKVDRESIFHSVEFQILPYQLGQQFTFFIFMDFFSNRILPLKACCLLSRCISILLYCFKHSWS